MLNEHLETMTFGEFDKKKIGTRAVLRILPTAITPNLTPKKEYEIIGKYGQGFTIKDDAGNESKVWYGWFKRGELRDKPPNI